MHGAKNMTKAATLVLALFSVPAGISTGQTIEGQKTESIPELGVEATATAGSPIYALITSKTTTSMGGSYATVRSSVSAPVADGVATLAEGEKLYPQNFGGKAAFVSLSPSYTPTYGGKPSEAYFIDLDGNGTFDEVNVGVRSGLFGRTWISATLPTPGPYSVVTENDVTATLGERFRKELLYLGYSKGTIHLQYREYIEHRARDAFYQDLAYDIESFPATVSFQTMQIEFLGAGNSGVRYRVLSGLAD